MRYPSLYGILLLAGLALPSVAASPDWKPVSASELSDNTPQIEPEAPAEILSYHVEIDDSLEREREVTTNIRIKIYDPGRAVDITRVARFWSGAGNQYYDIKARLTLPDGSTREFGQRDMRERNVTEEGRSNNFFGRLFQDSNHSIEEKFLAVTGVVKGAVLDVWEFQPELQKTNWVMTTVQRPDAPIRSFDYLCRYTTRDDKLHHTFVLNPQGGKMSKDEKAKSLRFTASNLPSIRREPFAAPDTYFSLSIIEAYEDLNRFVAQRSHRVSLPDSVPLSLGPWAFLATAQDYQDADKGYADKKVKEKAAELVSGLTDPDAKARAVYSYVQELYQEFHRRADLQIRYSRYIDSVDELMNLDKLDSTFVQPEDFNYLFIALLRSTGLECHSVFHPLRSSFHFRADFVSPQFLQGWSVAVKIGDHWVLCAPFTEVPIGYGHLPWAMEGEVALMALPRQQNFLTVPPLAAESSLSATTVDVTLDGEGNLKGHAVRTFTGHVADAARQELSEAGEEGWGKIARGLLGLANSSCEVHLQKVTGRDKVDEEVRIEADVYWPSYAPVLGGHMPFLLSVWTEGRPPLLNESKRSTPVFFQYPTAERETITVHLPLGFKPANMPKPVAATTPDFSYSFSVSEDTEHNVLRVERSAVNGQIAIPLGSYPQALDWFRRISVADQATVVLVRTDDHPAQK